MNFQEFKDKYLIPFEGLHFVFEPEMGYIVWRMGTGLNIELLHIRAFKKRQGYGTELIKRMLLSIKDNPPYYSLFGFGLASNTAMIKFYESLGFNIIELAGPYKHDHSIFIWQSYKILCDKILCS